MVYNIGMDAIRNSKRRARRNIKRWGIVLKNNKQERITTGTHSLAAVTYNGYQYQKPNTSVVYWISTPNHQDMFTEGYIGVTHQPVIERWRSHISNRKRGAARGRPISIALIQQPDIIFNVVSVHQTLQEALDMEARLRPHPFIGWNTAAGANVIDPVTGGKALQRAMLNKRKAIDPTYYQGKEQVLIAQRKWEADQRRDRIKYYRKVFAPLLTPWTNKRKARNKSGVLGVDWYKPYNKWRPQIMIAGHLIGLGYYESIDTAKRIRESAEDIYKQWRAGSISDQYALEATKALRKNAQ